MKIFTRYYYDCLQLTSFIKFDLIPITDKSLTFEDYYQLKVQEQKARQDETRKQHDSTDWEEVHRRLAEMSLQNREKFPEYNPEIPNRWFDEPPEKIVDHNFNENFRRFNSLLPEEIKKAVPDLKILALGFADKELIEALQAWAESIEQYWQENGKNYSNYLKTIVDKLPEETRIFTKFSMHDQKVLEVIKEDTCVKILYADEVWGKAFLMFKDVECFEAKDNILSYWLYDELYITENKKLELHALTLEGEFQVTCSAISIEVKEKDYISDLLVKCKNPEEFYIELNAIINSKGLACSCHKVREIEEGFHEVESIILSLHWTYLSSEGLSKLPKGFEQFFSQNSVDKAIHFLEAIGEKRFLKIIKEANGFKGDRQMLSKLSRRLKYAYNNHMGELYETIFKNIGKLY